MLRLFISKSLTKPLFASVVIFMFSIAVMLLLSIPLYNSFERDQHNHIFRIATDKASKIKLELYARMNLNIATASYIEQNPNLNQEEFSRFVNSILQYDDEVIAKMTFEKGFIITFIEPHEINKKAIGFDLSTIPDCYVGLTNALTHKKAFVEGPRELVEGGLAIISYIPIFLDDTTGESAFFGFTDVVVLWDKFLEVTGLDKQDDLMDFAIRGANGMGEAGAVFYGDSSLFNRKDVVKISIPLPLGEWVLAAHFKEEWKAKVIPLASIVVFVLTLLFSIFIYVALSKSHKQIKKNERRYRYITEKSRDILWTLDFSAIRLTYVSEACLVNLGYTQDEFSTIPLKETMPTESYKKVLEEIEAAIEQIKKGGTDYVDINFEIQHYTKTGELIWADISAAITKNNKGKIDEIVGATRFINDKKILELEILNQKRELDETNKKLIDVNATKDKFFSIISHDLKNNISGAAMLSDLLLEHYKTNDTLTLEDDMTMLKDTLNHTFVLLEDLLKWARSSMNKIVHTPTRNDIIKITDDCVAELDAQLLAKSITIQHFRAFDECYVYCDINMIHAVLRNLISNAIKYSYSDSTIEIGVSDYGEDSSYVQVSVKDSGLGISEDILSRLFKIDGQIVSSKGTNNEGGTGFGLLLCKEFIDKHKCKIWVESVEGKGSKFLFTLPKDI